MHNVSKKCIEQILRPKNRASLAFEKSIFWPQILNFGSFGVWISKNRQKWLSAVAKSFLRVVWCSELYQKIAWTLNIVFHTENFFKIVPMLPLKNIVPDISNRVRFSLGSVLQSVLNGFQKCIFWLVCRTSIFLLS